MSVRTDVLGEGPGVYYIKQSFGAVNSFTGLPVKFEGIRRDNFNYQISGGNRQWLDWEVSGNNRLVLKRGTQGEDNVAKVGSALVFYYAGLDTWIQPLDAFHYARWIVNPSPFTGSDYAGLRTTHWLLWRIEGPDGITTITRSEEIVPMAHGFNSGWIRGSEKNPVTVYSHRGDDLYVDGGGMPYGKMSGGSGGKQVGWVPAELTLSLPWYLYSSYGKQFLMPGYEDYLYFSYLDGFWVAPEESIVERLLVEIREYSKGYIDETFNNTNYFVPRNSFHYTNRQIDEGSPGDIVRLYYGIGRWEMNGLHCPHFVSPNWPDPVPDTRRMGWFEIESAVSVYDLREQIYTIRNDLHNIPLANGKTIIGLVDFKEIPPRDGLACRERSNNLITIIGYVGALFSLIPTGGASLAFILTNIAVNLAITAAQLAEQLDAIKDKNKTLVIMRNVVTGQNILGTVDIPGRLDKVSDAKPITGEIQNSKTGLMFLVTAGILAKVLLIK